MRHPTPPTSRRGFTLIELLVVMAILVILVLVALPVFNYISASRSTESGLNLASAMIGRARALALSRTDSKYIGVLFYHQADDNRDAMQIIEVQAADAASGLERYFPFQTGHTYSPIDVSATPPRAADVVYSQVLDRSLGGGSVGGLFNRRPAVKRFTRIGAAGSDAPPDGPPFTNGSWGSSVLGNTTPVTVDAEVQFLPLGVRAAVLKRDSDLGADIVTPGVILFDKQGRVTRRKWSIGSDNDGVVDGGQRLRDAMGAGPYEGFSAAVLSVYNEKDVTFSDGNGNDRPIDLTNTSAVAKWVKANAEQYTVGIQSGELLTGTVQP